MLNTKTNYIVIKRVVRLWRRATQEISLNLLFKFIITEWKQDVALSLYFDFTCISCTYVFWCITLLFYNKCSMYFMCVMQVWKTSERGNMSSQHQYMSANNTSSGSRVVGDIEHISQYFFTITKACLQFNLIWNLLVVLCCTFNSASRGELIHYIKRH